MSKKDELSNAEKLVKRILTDYPLARDDDRYLYTKVMQKLNPKACDLPFCEVMFNLKNLGLPLYSTVSRARRNVQANNEELRGTKKKQEIRAKLEEECREYFRG